MVSRSLRRRDRGEIFHDEEEEYSRRKAAFSKLLAVASSAPRVEKEGLSRLRNCGENDSYVS